MLALFHHNQRYSKFVLSAPSQAFGVFGLCQIHAFVDYVRSRLNKAQFEVLFRAVISTVAATGVLVLVMLTAMGKIAPWTGRFYSLLDPSYAKNNIPIIASVSEHQPTAWSSFYFDLQMLTFMFPVGLYFCFSNLTDENIFIILYGVLSIYFAVSVFFTDSIKSLFYIYFIVIYLFFLSLTCLLVLLIPFH